MSKGYLVFRLGDFYGILENKEEYKEFKKQRTAEVFEYVKMSEEEIHDATKNYNYGYYSSLNIRGYIMFPHEEIGLSEHIGLELDDAVENCNSLFGTFSEYYKFTDSEKDLLTTTLVCLSTTFKKEVSEGISYDDDSGSTLRIGPILETWVESLDHGEE